MTKSDDEPKWTDKSVSTSEGLSKFDNTVQMEVTLTDWQAITKMDGRLLVRPFANDTEIPVNGLFEDHKKYFGLCIDGVVRRWIGNESTPDDQLDLVFPIGTDSIPIIGHEIKSFCSESITFSSGEVELYDEMVQNGVDVLIWAYQRYNVKEEGAVGFKSRVGDPLYNRAFRFDHFVRWSEVVRATGACMDFLKPSLYGPGFYIRVKDSRTMSVKDHASIAAHINALKRFQSISASAKISAAIRESFKNVEAA